MTSKPPRSTLYNANHSAFRNAGKNAAPPAPKQQQSTHGRATPSAPRPPLQPTTGKNKVQGKTDKQTANKPTANKQTE